MELEDFRRIVGESFRENQWHYQVEWLDSEKALDWIPASHFRNHIELVLCFEFLSSSTSCFKVLSRQDSQEQIPIASMTLIEACFEGKECKLD